MLEDTDEARTEAACWRDMVKLYDLGEDSTYEKYGGNTAGASSPSKSPTGDIAASSPQPAGLPQNDETQKQLLKNDENNLLSPNPENNEKLPAKTNQITPK